MKCPVSNCFGGCRGFNYTVFGIFLILGIVIFLTHTNHSLFLTINSWHSYVPVVIWEFLNFVSNRKFFILPALLLIFTLIWRREKLANIILLIIAYFVVFAGLKLILGEARPYVTLDPNSFYLLNQFENAAEGANHSFPSGHVGNMAMFAFAISSMFFQNKRSLQFLMLLLVIAAGVTRICTGWHWPLDIIASGLIAYILVKVCLCIKFCRAC